LKIEAKALIEGVEDRSYVHPFRLESRCVSLSIFKQQSFFAFEGRAVLVFVPTLEDFPQAYRPFPQILSASTEPEGSFSCPTDACENILPMQPSY
jgi:hypothetical protein